MVRLLWTIAVVLVVLWLLGFALHIAGGLIHLLLVLALIVARSLGKEQAITWCCSPVPELPGSFGWGSSTFCIVLSRLRTDKHPRISVLLNFRQLLWRNTGHDIFSSCSAEKR